MRLLLILTLLLQHGLRGLLALTGCGKSLGSGKIVGGADAAIGEWPWQVSLQSGGVALCGGSLVSASWVLTAAHCFQTPVTTSAYTVYLGVNKLSGLKDPKTVVREVQQVIIHPDFTREGSSGDIALVQLRRPVTFTPSVLPVCLPSQPMNLPEGTRCWATGWGDVKDGLPLANNKPLQQVALPLINSKKCESMYQASLGYNPKIKVIKADMFCAGYKGGGKDTCQGDSGGPLACTVKGVWVQVGIISWGYGCAEPNHPGVYTRVQYYQSWIAQYVKSMQTNGKVKSVRLAEELNTTWYPLNSSFSYGLSDQNYVESENLTNNATDPKMDSPRHNGAYPNVWPMANSHLVLMGLVLLL